MRRFGPFLIGVVELVALVMVARWIGFGWALVLLLSTSVIGLALLRFEGFRAWAALRQAAADGQMDDGAGDGERAGGDPKTRIADTGARILAGLLLTVPGFVTDLVALVLLIPPIRRGVGRRLSAAAFRTFPVRRPGGVPGRGGTPGSQPGVKHGVVIEGEVIDSETAKDPRDGR